jgi:fucose 4-O-acetylase-like acetyltransferase
MESRINRWYHPSVVMDAPGDKQRNYYLDNLKFILMVLVVSTHFAMKMTHVSVINYYFSFVYIFHMPCFIFINGYLAKRMNAGGKLRVDKIFITLWMYAIFKIGNYALSYFMGQDANFNLFEDRAAPWYLLALSLWYLMVPLLERIKTCYLIPGSFVIGLLVGYINSIGDVFSLSRVFVFFPFFIIGFCISEKQLEDFLDKKYRVTALIYLVLSFGAIILFWNQVTAVRDIVYGSTAYHVSLDQLYPFGFLIRGAWYALALALSASVMLLVPRCKLFFSVLGERTLQVYMTHIWIRNALVYAGFFIYIEERPRYVAVIALFASVLLTFLLSGRWLKKLFDLCMSPKLFQRVLK